MTQQNPYALQNSSHSAALFRAAVHSAWLGPGIVSSGEYAVAAQSTPNMTVQVAGGRAWMRGTQVSNVSGQQFSTQSSYFGLNDAPVTVTIATANATNPRIDLVYVAVNDSFYSGTNNNAVIGVVTGTPAASPVAPAAPSNSLTLATVAVAANATSITNSNISQTAVSSLLAIARGGIDPVLSSSRPTAGLYAGYPIFETDTGRFYVYTGTAWEYVGGNPPPIATLPLSGSVTAYAGHTPGVFKDASGLVKLVGCALNSSSYNPQTTTLTIGTLPTGYRPATPLQAAIPAGTATGPTLYVQINTDGTVVVVGGGAATVGANVGHWLDGIPAFHPTYAGAVPLS